QTHPFLAVRQKSQIGFAKFRTRLEALEARDVLSGRKVDADKGSILKAEMAKKNLHTKRGLSNVQPHSCGHSIISSSAIALRRPNQGICSAYEAFHSVPAYPPDYTPVSQRFTFDYPYAHGGPEPYGLGAELLEKQYNSAPHSACTDAPSRGTLGGLVAAQRSLSFDNVDAAAAAAGSHHQQLQQPQLLHLQHQDQQQLEQPPEHAFGAAVSRGQQSAPISRLGSVKSLRDLPDVTTAGLAEAGNRLGSKSLTDLCSMSRSAPPNEERGFHSALFSSISSHRDSPASDESGASLGPRSIPGRPPVRLCSLSINAAAANSAQDCQAYQAQGTSSPVFAQSPEVRSANSADQNPPCSTLYVGNLPANASEEELHVLFSKCRGFKRMCLRAKPNGSMCFIEFDDVVCASQALRELQGSHISNSPKDGICLSYSKNPLGVRHHYHHHPFPSPVAVPASHTFIPAAPLSAPPAMANAAHHHHHHLHHCHHPFFNLASREFSGGVGGGAAAPAYPGVAAEDAAGTRTGFGAVSPWQETAGADRPYDRAIPVAAAAAQQDRPAGSALRPAEPPNYKPPVPEARAAGGEAGAGCGGSASGSPRAGDDAAAAACRGVVTGDTPPPQPATICSQPLSAASAATPSPEQARDGDDMLCG
ncbi:MAG: hypothetical protein BJ554DRAFT_1333, partial [Olpidium bornovanus]